MGKRKRTWPYIKAFNEYIRGTTYKQLIYLTEIEIRTLPKPLYQIFLATHPGVLRTVYVHTRVLKHIYDDHRIHSQEIISHLARIIGSPDSVYENKRGRKGRYLFTYRFNSQTYCAIVESTPNYEKYCLQVRTAFYASNPKAYLKDLKHIWKRS